MMQSLDTLNLLPVWVNPDHLAATAKIIFTGHRLKVLGVVEGQELVGVITAAETMARPDNAYVRDFMRRPERVIDASTPLRQIAEAFWQEDLDYLPVIEGDHFRGIVTPNMLIRELARSWDPLTGLSWSDSLREWGVSHLKEGHEITILFIDLDDFGNYNKRYGHIVGDRVLQRVGDMIQERISPTRDLLVRYGGDEFAVGTLRDQREALELAEELTRGMAGIKVAGSEEPISFCIGVQGGKRTKERENVHYAATLDNLINLASKACMAKKAERKGGPGPIEVEPAPAEEVEEMTPETASDLAEGHDQAPNVPETEAEVVAPLEAEEPEEAEPTGPMNVAEVLADAADANSVTHVILDVGGIAVTGVCPRKGGSVVKSVALATADAISQVRHEVKMEIREVNLTENDAGVRFISVTGIARIDSEEMPINGVGSVGRNLYQTVAEATLQAYLNRQSGRRGVG